MRDDAIYPMDVESYMALPEKKRKLVPEKYALSLLHEKQVIVPMTDEDVALLEESEEWTEVQRLEYVQGLR